MRKFAILLGILLFAAPQLGHAAGFSVYQQSPSGTALAGALTARPDDASAIFYNPAGLGFLNGLSLLAGATLISPDVTARQPGQEAGRNVYYARRDLAVLPNLYAALRLHDVLSVGIGAFSSHGLGINWRDDARPFPGRYKAEKAALRTVTINPTIALRPIPAISFAAGFDIVVASVELIRAVNFGDADGRLALTAGANAVGGNFGVLARLIEGRLSAGLSYRSPVSLSFEGGKVGFTPPPGAGPIAFPYTTGRAQLTLPHTLSVGLAVSPLRWLLISADVNAMLWSDIHELKIELTYEPPPNMPRVTQTSITPRDWRDAVALRLGIEGDFSRLLPEHLRVQPKVRLGFAYDQTPVPAHTLDPSQPDADRFLASAGLSLGYRGLGSVDLSYMTVFTQGRASQNPDLLLAYSTTAYVFSAALVVQVERILQRRSAAYAGGLFPR
jgi:long-chain fatty acid transport protein